MRRVRARAAARRGFSLIELIISMTIVLLAVGLAGAGFLAQNKALQAFDLHRQANASTRDAMLTLESALRTAGWGVDPRYAIDVYTADRSSVDNNDAPDELTVISRNPLYQWVNTNGTTCTLTGGCFTAGNAWHVVTLTTAAPPVLTIALGAGQVIEKGRMLQVQCLGGENPIILTASARSTTGSSMTMVANAFPYSDGTAIMPCHQDPSAQVYLLDRYHFFVRDYTGANGDPVPWLVLDTGLDLDGDGNLPMDSAGTGDVDDLIPIGKNIEDFQVAYLLRSAAGLGPDAVNQNWIVGDDPGGTEELPGGAGSATATPLYTTPLTDTSRTLNLTANVRAIRVSMIVRSARGDPNMPIDWAGDSINFSENRTGTTAALGTTRLRRFPAVTQLTLRNMDSQRPFTF